METINESCFQGGRSLENSRDLRLEHCVFFNGESALKDSRNIELVSCMFEWKYPLWYCKNINLVNTTLIETARSGIWYTHDIHIRDSVIEAPKTFRYTSNLLLDNVYMPNAKETLWNCRNIEMIGSSFSGDYFGMNCTEVQARQIKLTGNYCFDGGKDIVIYDSTLVSKDAFWNCSNVTVYNSTIIGEYLGWNSRNLTFVNCLISSHQGLSRIEGLKLVNCRTIKNGMLFELCSDIDAQIISDIGSVLNPTSGRIQANRIHSIITDGKNVESDNLHIITKGDGRHSN